MIKNNTSSLIPLFAGLLVLAILNGYLFNLINDRFFHYTNEANRLDQFSPLGRFMMIVVLAPLTETALLQTLPNIILTKCKLRSRFWLILIPSVLFGAGHFYFWLYAVMALVGGIFLNTLYLTAKERTRHYFAITMLFHALYNLHGYLFVE
jgi:hypothetical protein